MIEIVCGIIADTSHPALVLRLLRDLAELAELERGRCALRVLVLENPSAAAPRVGEALGAEVGPLGLALRCLRTPSAARLPIAAARTLIQDACARALSGPESCVWILDEDLRLTPLLADVHAGLRLDEEVRAARAAGADVILSPILGAPPLPARSIVRVNLADAHRHLGALAHLSPDAPWPDYREANVHVRRRFAEYYYDHSCAHGDPAQRPMWLESERAAESAREVFLRLCALVPGLLHGQPITRDLRRSEGAQPPQPLARGGNTLVLQGALLHRFANPAVCVGGRVVRRSDMLWARLARSLGGARFAAGRFIATQDRDGSGRSDFSTEKMVDDIRGSALIKAVDALLGPGGSQTRALEAYLGHRRHRLGQVQASELAVRQRVLVMRRELAADLAGRAAWYAAEAACRDALVELAATLRELGDAYQRLVADDSVDEDGELVAVAEFLAPLARAAGSRSGAAAAGAPGLPAAAVSERRGAEGA